MKIPKASIKWAVNAIILIAFLGALYHLVGNNFGTTEQYLRQGSTVKLANIDRSTNRRTLIIAVRPGCPWCTASAPFYRDILQSDLANAFKIVTISPDSVAVTQTYLRSLHLNVEDVRQANFDALGVQGTPTLILVNQKGAIESTWIGKLSPKIENEVFKALKVDRVSTTDANLTNQRLHSGRF